jgi:adenosylhomocysteine nucleosidase
MVIGLIGAMDEEIALLLEEMEAVSEEKYAGTHYHRGRLEDVSVVLCKSGVGKVNAAVSTQVLIDRYRVDAVIFTGVAGALHPDLDIGDMVISTACQHHDVDAGSLGFAPGEIPFQDTSVFQADPRLVALAEKASEKASGGKTMRGKILSGDQFISDTERVRSLHERFDGVCVEMEGAAVAHVCHLNRVPFVIIRSISDRADHSANVNFTRFTKMASRRSAGIVRRMLAELRQRGLGSKT